jgi:hypothetical protein
MLIVLLIGNERIGGNGLLNYIFLLVVLALEPPRGLEKPALATSPKPDRTW